MSLIMTQIEFTAEHGVRVHAAGPSSFCTAEANQNEGLSQIGLTSSHVNLSFKERLRGIWSPVRQKSDLQRSAYTIKSSRNLRTHCRLASAARHITRGYRSFPCGRRPVRPSDRINTRRANN